MDIDLLMYFINQTIPYVLMFICYLMLSKRITNIEKEIYAGIQAIQKFLEILSQQVGKK